MFDSEIIYMYEEDREKAAEMVDEKYGEYCREYAARFLESEEDIEESFDNMRIVLRQCIPSIRPGNLKLFITKIMRNTAYNKYKRIRMTKDKHSEIDKVVEELSDSFITTDDKDLDDMVIMRDAGNIVNKCLGQMTSTDRDVFIRRFYYIESEEEIAKRYMTTPENIRIVLENAKDRVRLALKRGGF